MHVLPVSLCVNKCPPWHAQHATSGGIPILSIWVCASIELQLDDFWYLSHISFGPTSWHFKCLIGGYFNFDLFAIVLNINLFLSLKHHAMIILSKGFSILS